MFAAVFEGRGNSSLPRGYLALALKNLSGRFSFIRLNLFEFRIFVSLDRDALDALTIPMQLYGYRLLGIYSVEPGNPLYEPLNMLMKRKYMSSRIKHAKRVLLSYIVSNAMLQNNELVVESIPEIGVSQDIAVKAAKSLNNLMLLAISARSLRQDAVLAFGHLVLHREPYYVIPLRRVAVAGSRRWRIEAEDIHKAAELIRKNCSNAATIEELQSCGEKAARRCHAMWRKLLRCVKRHPIYIELYAKTFVSELMKLGSDILDWKLWRVRLIV